MEIILFIFLEIMIKIRIYLKKEEPHTIDYGLDFYDLRPHFSRMGGV